MANNLSGKNVIITGASSGDGTEAAKLFAENGANLVLAARNEQKLTVLREHLPKFKISIDVLPTDVSKPTDCKKLVKHYLQKLGSIDIIVNNAGYTSQGNFNDVPVAELMQMIEVNFKAPVRLTKFALPHLKNQEE